jgi:hypothetical protein
LRSCVRSLSVSRFRAIHLSRPFESLRVRAGEEKNLLLARLRERWIVAQPQDGEGLRVGMQVRLCGAGVVGLGLQHPCKVGTREETLREVATVFKVAK